MKFLKFSSLRWVLPLSVVLWLPGRAAADENIMIQPDNMKELNCAMPDEQFRFAGSSAPGQLFFTGDPVDLRFVFRKGSLSGRVPFTLEIQEVGTRTPGKVSGGMAGWTDTTGKAPLFDRLGAPVTREFTVDFSRDEVPVEIKGAPVPAHYGTYALILRHGGERRFLGTVARVPRPDPNGTIDNVPIFGEGNFIKTPGRAAVYARMGVRGWRTEGSWNQKKDGTFDWAHYDEIFKAAKDAGCQVMSTPGATPDWTWPFAPHQTPAAVGPDWDGAPYGGQADWVCDPKYYPAYEKWMKEFVGRYGSKGLGVLWGVENYNEPWEGGGISGWARDMVQYREIQKLIARAVKAVDPGVKVLAASSIMNTEDKLFPDGSDEFDQYVDIFTDHYVAPRGCYGPMVARAKGKHSMETETWFVGTEYQLPQGVAQFLASGQKHISPWHPRALYENLPGGNEDSIIPSPVVTATAAFNHFVTGRPFEKIVFKDHLPWVFQFGGDADKDALLVVFGQLVPIGSSDPRDLLWAQVNAAEGGEITIDNADGLLQFFDLSGNPAHVGEKSVTLPLTIFPTYIRSAQGPQAAAARLAAAKISGKRPVEILPRDFTTLLTRPDAMLQVGVHNCLNRPIQGRLAVKAPDGFALKEAALDVALAAGETKVLDFPVTSAQPNAENAYPFAFAFTSDAGDAGYEEVMHVAAAPKAAITVDGDLGEWKDIPGVAIFGGDEKVDTAELLRRPWLALQKEHPGMVSGRLKMAWDDEHLYLCAEVNDPTDQKNTTPMAGRDENKYFHSAASDTREPFKRWLAKHAPGRSFAEVPYVYADSPETPRQSDLPWLPFRRDRLQFALDVTEGWHDMAGDADRVPYGFHAVPDTDYEYSLYACDGGTSELWRHLAPGVPRIHDMPRQPHGARTTGLVGGATHVVQRDGATYRYELAIPKSELADLKLEPGTDFGFLFKIGNGDGPSVESGTDKAVTKTNSLSLHPYWNPHVNCGVRWTLRE
ncbi:MAG: hypothetical protein IAE97_00505 [Chthoniobacterales bacterium]|nr:hypothetical protein [Chthoniobacterales bacterium]